VTNKGFLAKLFLAVLLFAAVGFWIKQMPVEVKKYVTTIPVYPLPAEPCESLTPFKLQAINSEETSYGSGQFDTFVTLEFNDKTPLVYCAYRGPIDIDAFMPEDGHLVYPANLGKAVRGVE